MGLSKTRATIISAEITPDGREYVMCNLHRGAGINRAYFHSSVGGWTGLVGQEVWLAANVSRWNTSKGISLTFVRRCNAPRKGEVVGWSQRGDYLKRFERQLLSCDTIDAILDFEYDFNE